MCVGVGHEVRFAAVAVADSPARFLCDIYIQYMYIYTERASNVCIQFWFVTRLIVRKNVAPNRPNMQHGVSSNRLFHSLVGWLAD